MSIVRRFILVNIVACGLFMLLWASIIIIDVKVRSFRSLQSLYILSLVLCLVGIPVLNWAAFRSYDGKVQIRATAFSGALALAFIYAGIIGMIELKVALGGGK